MCIYISAPRATGLLKEIRPSWPHSWRQMGSPDQRECRSSVWRDWSWWETRQKQHVSSYQVNHSSPSWLRLDRTSGNLPSNFTLRAGCWGLCPVRFWLYPNMKTQPFDPFWLWSVLDLNANFSSFCWCRPFFKLIEIFQIMEDSSAYSSTLPSALCKRDFSLDLIFSTSIYFSPLLIILFFPITLCGTLLFPLSNFFCFAW